MYERIFNHLTWPLMIASGCHFLIALVTWHFWDKGDLATPIAIGLWALAAVGYVATFWSIARIGSALRLNQREHDLSSD